MARSFVDLVHLQLRAGKGGGGAVSFLRERGRPKGGPDGGDGGAGGSVFISVTENLNTLSHLAGRNEICAQNGQRGAGGCRTGHGGVHAYVCVPPGTLVYEATNDELLLDTANISTNILSGKSYELLHGGRGGKGNHHFKGANRQLPRFAQEGEVGQSGYFRLELRLIADIGLVGFPNAGKSSFQNLLTRAQAKVGAYPFTTTVPNLGVLKVFDEELLLADIPGIIQGASEGHGLGLKFLGHIARAAALLFVVDAGEPNAAQKVAQLRKELALYDQQFQTNLQRKPWAILANKMDIPAAKEQLHSLSQSYPDVEIVAASCLDSQYIPTLQKFLLSLKATFQ